ncbi:hypothetical protein F511_17219 [Dorcoceras hygrometricum]|uniref:DUF6737 domain-containing protein n=1 Tax=Dorcoceras hygrometricum TaxID=472368 RepID=A0A2Z7AU43_9LAMI|nr:hypothetical protein F511_17219 [Dorcoceras hygrometricum]
MIALNATLSHFPISLVNVPYSSSSQITCNKSSSIIGPSSVKAREQKYLRRSGFRDGVDPLQEPSFFDENGVVQDMDGYLNYLSLEYDSVWDTKPSWCQPWTITLTGIGIIICSWLVMHSLVVSGLVGALICAWWYIFLYSYPKAYSDMISERRKNVTSGFEDTYGKRTEESS